MPNWGLRALVDAGQPHEGHEAPHALAPDLMSLLTRMERHLLRAVPGHVNELALDRSHDGEGLEAFCLRAAVEVRRINAIRPHGRVVGRQG